LLKEEFLTQKGPGKNWGSVLWEGYRESYGSLSKGHRSLEVAEAPPKVQLEPFP
jgi:hypothetical protein